MEIGKSILVLLTSLSTILAIIFAENLFRQEAIDLDSMEKAWAGQLFFSNNLYSQF